MRHGLGFHNRHSAGGFQPISLFTGGVQGAWYDPSDFGASGTDGVGTLFQDAAGTTPVTAVEQAVGLMLDKSKGLVLGPELVTNGDFSQGSTGWTVGTDWSISSGQASHVAGASLSNLFIATPLFVSGLTYQLTIDIVSISGGNLTVFCGDASSITFNTPGTKTMRLRAAGDLRLYIQAAAATVVTVDNISAKLLPGNHAYQSINTSRPTLRARYNLYEYSEQFDNAYWTKQRSSVSANATTAPDGTLTAEKLIEDTSIVNSHDLRRILSVFISGATYTMSIYAKAAERSAIGLFAQFSSAGAVTYFNLANGTIGTVSANATAAIQDAGNGWYRCSITVTANATSGGVFHYLCIGTTPGSDNYTGDGTSGIFIWGAQITQNAVFPSNTYQRIGAATDYATGAAFPPYLFFDGTDDSMLTNSVDFATVTSDGQARRNLLLNPTQFDAAGWTLNQLTVTANNAVAPDGTTTADKLIPSAVNTTHSLFNSPVVTVSAGVAYTASVYVKAAEYNFAVVVNNTLGAYTASVCINLTTGAQSNAGASGTYTVTDVGNGWWRVTATATATTTNGYLEVWPRATAGAANTAFAGDGTSGVLAWGAQLETGSTATAFQNIGTDKMLVVAGVTKSSDAAAGVLLELSANFNSNIGTFLVSVPEGANTKFAAALSQGNGSTYNAAEYTDAAAPLTTVNSVNFDKALSTNEVVFIRKNGADQSLTRTINGNTTGNFGNYPLFIGRRNNASAPFNGSLFSLIIAGQSYSSGQISSTESWVAAKTPLGTI